MNVLGIDFTSRPRKGKTITCLHAVIDRGTLVAGNIEQWHSFEQFEEALLRPGPWIAAIDFPFGQSARFIEQIGWPREWRAYVRLIHGLGREGWRATLEDYKKYRPPGDREHRRRTDVLAGSLSPQKLHGVPVGLMFFEGAPRLINAGVTIPGLQLGDPGRIVVEGYPGCLARGVVGRASYKSDRRRNQSTDQLQARRQLLDRICDGALMSSHGIKVRAHRALAEDPTGDQIDALLCAIQAAWAWNEIGDGWACQNHADNAIEGWIANPLRNADRPMNGD